MSLGEEAELAALVAGGRLSVPRPPPAEDASVWCRLAGGGPLFAACPFFATTDQVAVFPSLVATFSEAGWEDMSAEKNFFLRVCVFSGACPNDRRTEMQKGLSLPKGFSEFINPWDP